MPAPGPDKALCGAQRAGQPEGVTCRQVAGYRTDHLGVGRCYRHGGNTPTHAKAAQVEAARQLCDRLGIARPVDPATALLDLIAETSGNVEFYRSVVEQLPTYQDDDVREIGDDGEPHWKLAKPGIVGRTYHQSGMPTGKAEPSVYVLLYNEERDRLKGLVTDALKLGLEERRVRMVEAEARDLLAGVMHAARLAEMTAAQLEVFRRGLADYLRRSRPAALAG